MTIPMEIPVQFAQRVLDGSLVRYGCILKDAATGRITGHLVELASLSGPISAFPLGGTAVEFANTAVNIGQWIDTHRQLKAIEALLSRLGLIGSVGALASVAGIGVSVAGFALVLRRLHRLEHNLNGGMEKIRQEVQQINLRMEMLEMAELASAWESFSTAPVTNRPERTGEMLQSADRTFQKYRQYYYSLITKLDPLRQSKLSLSQACELVGRFKACCLSELEANFLLGDFPQWHERHKAICAQLRRVCEFSARDIFRARVDAMGRLASDAELRALEIEVNFVHDFCKEGHDRIASAAEETKCGRKWADTGRISARNTLFPFGRGSYSGSTRSLSKEETKNQTRPWSWGNRRPCLTGSAYRS